MEHNKRKYDKWNWRELDPALLLIPLAIVLVMGVLFFIRPEESTLVLDSIRGFLCNDLGFFYILLGVGVFFLSLYLAFSKFGKIRLGDSDKPQYSNFKWGSMIFTGVFAADLIFYSFIEWALYAGEQRIADLGGMQMWASTYPLFHWGPIPWAIYIVLAVPFGFMLHVRGRSRQKYSEACRPLLGDKTDGLAGKAIDLVAICALLAGTATTFSVTTPLLSSAISRVLGIPSGVGLTVAVLVCIAVIYTISVLFGIKGIIRSAAVCVYLFFAMLIYFLFAGGEAVYIIETGVTAIGNLVQNFIGMATWMDPLRASGDGVNGFVQNWTVFYWAYWMAWAIATPFFIGMISRGRTVKNVVLGTYTFGLAGTFLAFIIFGNYGLSQQIAGNVDMVGAVAAGTDLNLAIVSLFETLPGTNVLLLMLFVMMVAFYSTTFDSLTMVVSAYSYKRLTIEKEAHPGVKVFWALVFIILPIGLIFAQNTINSLQSVSIIAAFPIGIVMILIVISFFKDAKVYLAEQKALANAAELEEATAIIVEIEAEKA